MGALRHVAIAACAQVVLCGTRLVTINNTAPRLDVDGQIMDAHDCSIRQLPNGTYIMHAIEYGLCTAPTGEGCDQTPDHCGFQNDHNVSVWTSPDLSSGSWTWQGYAFPYTARPAGLIFRPEAIYNPNTGLWVLTYNQASGGNTYVTSVSASPFGPFSDFRTSNVTDATWSGGDFHLFVDKDNTGYIIWTAMSGLPGDDHKIKIQRLTPDFRGATSDAPYMFSESFCEAPMLFERDGTYYALFGHCCCYCYQGSGLFVHTAPHPLGSWTLQSSPVSDVSCEEPPPPPPPQPANPFCAYRSVEGYVNVTLECVNGVIDEIPTALYGLQTGSCPNYEASPTCNDNSFLAYVQSTCLGNQKCHLTASGIPDPCFGTIKSFAVVAHCSEGPGGYSPDGPVPPPPAAAAGAAAKALPVSVKRAPVMPALRPAPPSRDLLRTPTAAVNIDALGGVPTPGQGCLYGGGDEVSVTRSQQSFIATLPDGSGGFTFLEIGDRWGQSPDGLKGHEPQYVYPLSWNADGTINHINWNDTVTFPIQVADSE